MSIDSTVARRMTMVNDETQEKRFVSSVLPWVLAGAALLLYLITLNHWVSLGSLGTVGMVSSWFWQPELSRPLYWLVTSPLRLLPASFIPLALNLFAALCGAAILALLARSVALLPQDRTEDQRLREKSAFSTLSIRSAWLPPVLAVLICGLQLTFWENATAASSEIFDLLLFAYIVRCLLEFRLDNNDSWLFRACLVYGAAATNNWAMIGFIPVFATALIWLKGLEFFNLRFLGQALLLGGLGLCFYLLLPVATALSSHGEIGVWEALKLHLADQKNYLALLVNRNVLFRSEHPMWVLALPSLLPVLAISLRWPSYFGDPSQIGVVLAKLIFHILHAALLAVCLWVSLDPKFSPRNYAGMPGLPLYYLGALSLGYFAGYFLLIFGGAKPVQRSRPIPGYPPALNALVTLAIWLALFLVPACLLNRNLPQIYTTNGSMLRNYAELVAKDVPVPNSVVLSDDPFRLMLLKSVWTQKHEQNQGLLLDTRSLANPFYQRFLAKQYPGRWQTEPTRKTPFQDPELQRQVVALSASNSVYYLHPSFGYYFEPFYAEPHQLVYRLKAYPAGTLLKPSLPSDLVQQNQAFWTGLNDTLLKQVREAARSGSGAGKETIVDRILAPLLERVRVTTLANSDAAVLGRYTSRALDALGVDLQRQGMLAEAAADFLAAKELLTNNLVADINLEYNRTLQDKTALVSRSLEERLGGRSLHDVMTEGGPFDEPVFCYLLGTAFFRWQNYRQAAQEFNRVIQLVPVGQPENLASRLLLARSALVLGLPEEGLKVVNSIRAQGEALGFSQTHAADLLQLEAISYLYKKDTNTAVKTVETALSAYPTNVYLLHAATKLYLDSGLTNSALKLVDAAWNTYPRDPYLLEVAVQVYLNAGATNSALQRIESALSAYPTNEVWMAAGTKAYLDSGCYSNALETANQQLKLRPDNVSAMYAKGIACLQLGAFPEAVAAFTPIVQLGTNDDFAELYYLALNNRAYASWKSSQLEDARKDYESLRQAFPAAIKFSYFLGEIDYAKKDAKSALRNYRMFLEHAPTNSPEASNVLARLKELRR